MTALSRTQSELLDRLRVLTASRNRIAQEQEAWEQWVINTRAEFQAQQKQVQEEEVEVWKQIDSLDENGDRKPVTLSFDTKKRIIRWDGGQIRLGRISFCIVKTLYDADGCEITKTDLEEQVWGAKIDETIRSVIYKLEREKLAPCHFPYVIVSRKCNGWVSDNLQLRMEPTVGYQLIPRE